MLIVAPTQADAHGVFTVVRSPPREIIQTQIALPPRLCLVSEQVTFTVTGATLRPIRAIGQFDLIVCGEPGWVCHATHNDTMVAHRIRKGDRVIIASGVLFAFVPDPGRLFRAHGTEVSVQYNPHCACEPPDGP